MLDWIRNGVITYVPGSIQNQDFYLLLIDHRQCQVTIYELTDSEVHGKRF